MDLLNYQRTVFGFHGCDCRVADTVLAGKLKLSASVNTYDWLGSGIYFWEHGPARALEWAAAQARRKGSGIKTPAVLGAVIQLGHCFDLLDTRYTRLLAVTAEELEAALHRQGRALPDNQKSADKDFDWLKRNRDCFVLNSALPILEDRFACRFQSVRGVFQEGDPAFRGAGIQLKSHIQVAVRDPACVIGYFRLEGF